jgi:phage terminase large subunit GpA-like protein
MLLDVEAPLAEQSVRRAYLLGARPEPPITVSEWADRYRRLPQKSSAEPGPWRTSRTPYLREIMDCMSPSSRVREVVFMASAQVGKTESLLNVLGYIVDHAPGPTLAVQPTVDLAKRFSRQRVEPLFDDTPRLAGKVAEEKSRDHRGSMLQKMFRGGILVLTGANSAVGLRSMPARYLLADEIDGYPVDVDGEGAPVELAEARQRTFARFKRMKTSTPTVAGLSPIEQAYLATDMRRYFVPCPECLGLQTLDFPRIQWSQFDLKPQDAVYVCLYCEARIEDHQKTWMLDPKHGAEWRPTAEEETDPKVRGYHISALYSPVGWLSWGDIAKMFVKVHKTPEKFRVFTNTVLGESWVEKGEAPEWERIYARRENYEMGTVPVGALNPTPTRSCLITAGVDVQKDRLIVEVVAWGKGKESWSLDYGEIPGNTDNHSDAGPWPLLDELLSKDFRCEDGTTARISLLAIDSGFNTQSVYAWARTHSSSVDPRTGSGGVIAVKGLDGGGSLIGSPSTVDITARGKRPVSGYKMWPVRGAVAKSELYGFIGLDSPLDGEKYPPGFCHFPQYDDEFFKQLTAEHLVTHRTRGGFTKLVWELIPGRENHVLDCRVYARAAASLCGMDRWKDDSPKTLQAPTPKPAQEKGRGWLGRR